MAARFIGGPWNELRQAVDRADITIVVDVYDVSNWMVRKGTYEWIKNTVNPRRFEWKGWR